MTIRTKLLREHEDILARALELNYSRGSLKTPAYATNVHDIDKKLVNENDLLGIAEIHAVFKPEQLEELSKDISLQQVFEYRINSYMRKISVDQLLVAIPILEGKKDYSININDTGRYSAFVAELITNPRVDVICTPVFHRIPEELIPIFTEKFLETMTTYSKDVVLTIPYASRDIRSKVVEIYLKWIDKNNRALLNFLCVDYNGSNPISKYSFHNFALGYVRLLEREIGEPVIIYGVNIKYSRVAKKYDELPARDLASYFAQVDIYGRNHKRQDVPGEVAEKLRADKTVKKQKLLNTKRYTYISLDKMLKDNASLPPEIKPIEHLLEERSRSIKRVERIVRLINIKNTNKEVKVLRQIFSGKEYGSFKDPLQYLESKDIVHIDSILVERLKKLAKVYGPRTKSLDEYFSK